MSLNPEERKSTRFKHKASITREDIAEGLNNGAKMFNYSKDGMYFEADFLLKAGDEIYIGIEDSPYSEEEGEYECYRAIVQWRKDFKGSESAYKYGYGIKYYFSEKESSDESEEEIINLQLLTDIISEKWKDGNKRKHPRKVISKRIIFAFKENIFKGVLKNISRGGAFIETRATFKMGHKLTLAFPRGARKKPFKLSGKVVWSSENGFGLEFSKKI